MVLRYPLLVSATGLFPIEINPFSDPAAAGFRTDGAWSSRLRHCLSLLRWCWVLPFYAIFSADVFGPLADSLGNVWTVRRLALGLFCPGCDGHRNCRRSVQPLCRWVIWGHRVICRS